jgi:hypothetical protein
MFESINAGFSSSPVRENFCPESTVIIVLLLHCPKDETLPYEDTEKSELDKVVPRMLIFHYVAEIDQPRYAA